MGDRDWRDIHQGCPPKDVHPHLQKDASFCLGPGLSGEGIEEPPLKSGQTVGEGQLRKARGRGQTPVAPPHLAVCTYYVVGNLPRECEVPCKNCLAGVWFQSAGVPEGEN